MAVLRRASSRASGGELVPPRPAVPRAPDAAQDLDAALPDRDWSVLPAGARSRSVAAPSGRLAVIEAGDARRARVLLLPGVTGSKEDFSIMLPLLVDAGFFVQSADLAGQYESAGAGPENLVPPRASYDHDLFVDDLIALLEHGLPDGRGGSAHVLGYSFAGTVAALVATRRPDLVLTLALLSAPPLSGHAFRGVKRIGVIAPLVPPRTIAALVIAGIRRNVIPVVPGRLQFVRDRFALTRRSSVADIIGLMTRTPDLGAQLRATGIPTLIAVGERDVWPLAQHAAFARGIGARLVVYRTGHSPCETAPHQLVRDLLVLYSRSASD